MPVVSRGSVYTISDGQSDFNDTVQSGGLLVIDPGGVAETATVQAGGAIDVSSGGFALAVVLDAGGYVYVSSGGITSNTNIAGTEIVLDGGSDDGSLILAGGVQIAGSGGVTSDTVIGLGGREVVGSGAVARDTIIDGGGTLDVAIGGTLAGPVTFAGVGGTLIADSPTGPGTTLDGFTAGDSIDLAGLTYVSGSSTVTLTGGNVLTVTEGGDTVSVQLDPTLLYGGNSFVASSDGLGGTEITYPFQAGLPITLNVYTANQLLIAIDSYNQDTTGGSYVINLQTAAAVQALPADLAGIGVHQGGSLEFIDNYTPYTLKIYGINTTDFSPYQNPVQGA